MNLKKLLMIAGMLPSLCMAAAQEPGISYSHKADRLVITQGG